MKANLQVSKKTFQKDGKWIEHPHRQVIVCACGNKYLKTRVDQVVCVRCMSRRETSPLPMK